jgi:hypothetical protein
MASHLPDKYSTAWAMSPTLFALVIFSDRVLCFCPRPRVSAPPTYASCKAGIIPSPMEGNFDVRSREHGHLPQ